MQRIILIVLFILFGAVAHAAAPVLFFSDMTDGVNTGFDGDANKGAAVTLWGLNFGSSGSISCGGQTVLSTSCPEWGATTNPTTARGLERITFHLTSAMSTGSTTISVTTSEGTSSTVPFYVRATGNIYFVDDATGSDSNTTTQAKSTSTPWKNPGKAIESSAAGDAIYLRSGTYDTPHTPGSAANTVGVMTFRGGTGYTYYFAHGTANNSCTIKSYPGELATIDAYAANASDADCVAGVYRYGAQVENAWNYWTISNMYIKGEHYGIATALESGTGTEYTSTSHIRLTGLEIWCPYDSVDGGVLAVDFGGGRAVTDLFTMYGNYIHDINQDTRGDLRGQSPGSSNDYRSYPLYLVEYGVMTEAEIAYNEFGYVVDGRGCQLYGHGTADHLYTVYFHHNYIHDVSNSTDQTNGVVISGGDGGSTNFLGNGYFYSNIISYCIGAGFLSNTGGSDQSGTSAYIYNNILYVDSVFGSDPTSASHVELLYNTGLVNMYNNIFYKVGTDRNQMGTDTSGTKAGSTNLFYNTVKKSWDTSTLTATDPLFTDSTPDDGSYSDFFPTASSPTINTGTVITYGAPNDTYDFYGVARGDAWDIGAFEYTDGGSSPSTPSITGVGLSNAGLH